MYIGENTLKPLSLQKTMSTANVQNLLSNVFRPTFVYDIGNQVYRTKLELLNIDTVSANMVSTFFASVGDVRSNVYVGIGAGNPYSNMVSSSNYYTTFLGAGAGFGSWNAAATPCAWSRTARFARWRAPVRPGSPATTDRH